MVFSSLTFLFAFLPVLLACYFVIPCRSGAPSDKPSLCRELRNLILLAFSLFFYYCAGPRFLPLMVVSILFNYLFGLLVSGDGKKHPGLRKTAAAVSVAGNLALLGWFKYAVLAAATLSTLGLPVPIPQITLPVGISFFTFQGMSYVLDVYRGDAPAAKNPLRVALYIALFPQLIAGPIVRYTTVAQELRSRRETVDDFVAGAVRFLFGLAKKMLLANPLGQIADAAFSTPLTLLSTPMAWLGVAAYTGQIYYDFSGYSDMAIGLGQMFGFHFLENFNYPYISRSITEFWRRWHMSLSSWFRDYLYIPLGGNRCSRPRQIWNLLVVWAATGLWHGANWTFLTWGLYYALLLIGERYLWGRWIERLPSFLRHLYALLFIMLGWLIFRAPDLAYAGGALPILFGFSKGGLSGQAVYYLLEFRWELLLAVLCALPWKVWAEKALAQRGDKPLAHAAALWGPKLLSLLLGFWCVVALVSATFNPFIYFQF